MPQISISKDIDAAFLAEIAILGNAWGSIVNENDQTFAFETAKFDAVEQALIDYPERYLHHRKMQKLEQLAEIRKTHEMNGPQGLYLDDKTVQRLTAAAVGLLIDTARETVRWELTRGVFVTFTRQQVLGLAALAVGHVQACFDNVFEKTESIKAVALVAEDPTPLATALAALESVDLTTGWPTP